MLQNLRNRAAHEAGFTLIELLVVVLIIGILAAIALPTFLGQREKAQDSSAKSDVRNMASHMESCFTENETYAGCQTSITSATSGLSIGAGAGQVQVTGTPGLNAYVIVAKSKSNRTFTITHGATNVRTCTPTGGGCNGTSW